MKMSVLFVVVLFTLLLLWFVLFVWLHGFRNVGSRTADTITFKNLSTITLMRDSPERFASNDKRVKSDSRYELLSMYRAVANSFRFLWLSNWSSDVSLAELPLLGTHHSCTYKLNGIVSLYAKTQTANLWRQLNMGVRCFDIRLKLDTSTDTLYLYHDIVPLRLSWPEVAAVFSAWLSFCPLEALILFVRDENYKNHADIARRAFTVFPHNVITNNNNFTYVPLLRNMRGKIFAINWDGGNGTMPWADNREFIVGRYRISDTYDVVSKSFSDRVDEKCDLVARFYNSARSDESRSTDSRDVRIAFTSLAATNANPFTSVKYTADRVNLRLQSSLFNGSNPMTGMILFIDYYDLRV